MSDYIKREDALDIILKYYPRSAKKLNIYREINNLPAADVAEVRHGHWEFPIFTDNDDVLDPRVKCSKCGKIEAAFARWKYCPNCEARMDEEDVHETG